MTQNAFFSTSFSFLHLFFDLEKVTKRISEVYLFPVDGHVSIVSLLNDQRAAAIIETAFPSAKSAAIVVAAVTVIIIVGWWK